MDTNKDIGKALPWSFSTRTSLCGDETGEKTEFFNSLSKNCYNSSFSGHRTGSSQLNWRKQWLKR